MPPSSTVADIGVAADGVGNTLSVTETKRSRLRQQILKLRDIAVQCHLPLLCHQVCLNASRKRGVVPEENGLAYSVTDFCTFGCAS